MTRLTKMRRGRRSTPTIHKATSAFHSPASDDSILMTKQGVAQVSVNTAELASTPIFTEEIDNDSMLLSVMQYDQVRPLGGHCLDTWAI